MLRKRFVIGLAVLVLVGVIAGCLDTPEQPSGTGNTFIIKGRVLIDAYHYDEATGAYIPFYHYESSNLIVNIGKDWIEDQLGDSPATDPAKWISLSTDVSAPAVGWTQIPTEIAAGGLARAVGTYSSTGVGAWEIEATFTASATHTDVQLTGLQWVVTAGSDNNLMAANTFTTVTLTSGDALTVTWQLDIT